MSDALREVRDGVDNPRVVERLLLYEQWYAALSEAWRQVLDEWAPAPGGRKAHAGAGR
jgi:hypothetical protein